MVSKFIAIISIITVIGFVINNNFIIIIKATVITAVVIEVIKSTKSLLEFDFINIDQAK